MGQYSFWACPGHCHYKLREDINFFKKNSKAAFLHIYTDLLWDSCNCVDQFNKTKKSCFFKWCFYMIGFDRHRRSIWELFFLRSHVGYCTWLLHPINVFYTVPVVLDQVKLCGRLQWLGYFSHQCVPPAWKIIMSLSHFL